jgi:uncharacterized protein YdhG (YjbR/CyaY superfamily)
MKTTPVINFNTVDEYLSAFPPGVRDMLAELRKAIRQAAPEAGEVISYNMPAYKFHGIVVYFAAHKNHIGFYPGSPVVNEVFKNELTGYDTSKGTIRFPLNKKLPLGLIKNIVLFKVNANLMRAGTKAKKKTAVDNQP